MAPAPLPAKKVLSPSAWQKELQRTVAVAVAVAVLDKVSGAKTMTIKNLQNKIYLFYHGDPSVKGSIGYLENLLRRGMGQFEDLRSTREELNTNLPGNADRVSAFDLVLKDCYSRDSQNRHVVGSQFTSRSLAGTAMKNMTTLITG